MNCTWNWNGPNKFTWYTLQRLFFFFFFSWTFHDIQGHWIRTNFIFGCCMLIAFSGCTSVRQIYKYPAIHPFIHPCIPSWMWWLLYIGKIELPLRHSLLCNFFCCRLSLPLLLVELPMYVCYTQSVVLYVYYIIPEIDTNRVVSYDSYCNAKPFETDNHTYVHM